MRKVALVLAFGSLCILGPFTFWNVRTIRLARLEIADASLELAKLHELVRDRQLQLPASHDSLKELQGEMARLVSPQEAPPVWKSLPLGEAGWTSDETFLDMPKTVLRGFGVSGFSFLPPLPSSRSGVQVWRGPGEMKLSETKVTTEAAAFLGLTEFEQESLAALYVEMNSRFEQLERRHFARADQPPALFLDFPGESMSFVIASFPEEMATLKREWTVEMEQLLGATRAAIFEAYAANTPSPPPGANASRASGGAAPRIVVPMVRPPSDWLRGGTNETLITVTFPSRTVPFTSFTYSKDGKQTEGSSPLNRWPHLLTPEVLARPSK